MSLGWTGPLVVADKETQVHGYPRFDNPNCGTVASGDPLAIRHQGMSLALDFAANRREVS